LPLFDRYGYIKMIKCLMTKTLLFYRLSTESIGTLCLRSSLQRMEDQILYMKVCARLKAMVRNTFFQLAANKFRRDYICSLTSHIDSELAPKFRRNYICSLVM
jgi:hypothetical protein